MTTKQLLDALFDQLSAEEEHPFRVHCKICHHPPNIHIMLSDGAWECHACSDICYSPTRAIRTYVEEADNASTPLNETKNPLTVTVQNHNDPKQ